MNCTICHKPIILVPSAAERAAKDVTGKTAAYYTSLFTEHAECSLAKRDHSADCLCNICTAGIGDTPDEPMLDYDEDVV